MRRLAGLVALFAVLVLLNASASAQNLSVLGDRIFIEKDGGILTLVWTGTVFFFKPSPEPVVVSVKYELSPLGGWQERETSSTIYISSRTVGAKSLRQRIAIATTEAQAVMDPVALFDKDQVLRLSFAVKRPGASSGTAPLAQADHQLKPMGYLLRNSAANGNVSHVRELVEAGADIDSASIDNFTPLMTAAGGGHAEVVKFLLEKGASLKPRTKGTPFADSPFGSKIPGGWNALMAAASSGNADIVSMLLAKGANVNSAMEDRKTPLLSAVEGGSAAVVQLLLDRGADVNFLSDSGYSPLAMADINGQGAIARTLASRGGRVIVPWDILSGTQ